MVNGCEDLNRIFKLSPSTTLWVSRKLVGSFAMAASTKELGVADDKSRDSEAFSGMQMSAHIKKSKSRLIEERSESMARNTLNGKTTSPS